MEPQYRTDTPQVQGSEAAGDASPRSRETVGMLLREKRESFRQDLDTVAGQLHIRLAYLKAIEDGRFKDLPGLTYASGFVRSYADYLGLDGEEMVRRFREEIAGMDRHVQLIFPSLATEGKIPGGAVLLLSAFLAVMAYGVWYYLADRQKSMLDLVPAVPAQLRALLGGQPESNTASTNAPGETKPGAATVANAGTGPTTHPAAPAPVVAAPPPPPPPPATTVLVNPGELPPLPSEIDGLIAAAQAASTSNQAAGSMQTASNTQPASNAMSSTAAGTPAAVQAAPPAPAVAPTTTSAAGGQAPASAAAKPAGQVVVSNPGAHVKLTARMDSWVQIYDKAGKSYYSAVLRAGQTIEVPNQPGLLLTTGNIGGLDILIDGQALAALGSVGLVKRDLPLDVAQLKSASAGSQ
ncbi:MAG TPA: RodZ domain-containing protein [Candidatus Polarisedimenticolia bacterium]|nr:RodZ domain-containing protein [Candidatus Polarisedimenticolia bacterium]